MDKLWVKFSVISNQSNQVEVSTCIIVLSSQDIADSIKTADTEFKTEEYIKNIAKKLKGVFYQHSGSHLILLNDREYVGHSEQFATYILHRFAYMDNSSMIVDEQKAS